MEGLLHWLSLLDQQPAGFPAGARPQDHPNPAGAAAIPQHNPVSASPAPNSPPSMYSNTGTQNMKGLINNTGYTTGNGNGAIVFGSFHTSTRRSN